jgi:glycine hydroxymethyltransferase
MSELQHRDQEVWEAIRGEEDRERRTLNLIASENVAGKAVLEAQGCLMTNKYAEGYPGRRYYGGCEQVDVVETLAIERAKRLFDAEHANVQPHSGSQANMAVYMSVLKPGDVILGMAIAHGGHLTHGSKVNFSGQLYEAAAYGVSRDAEVIDYDEVKEIARKVRPRLIIAGASAYPRTIDFDRFGDIAKEVGAYLMVDMAHIAGLIAGGVHPSPVGQSDFVTSTTHKTLRGPRAGFVLCKEVHGKQLDKAMMPGIQGGPLMHIIAAKAVCFKLAMQEGFREYQRQIVKNAAVLARGIKEHGMRLVSGGTDNHLMLVDLRKQGITGREAEKALGLAGIAVNKNLIPFDETGPMVTSGIRIGSPTLTTRGMKEGEMERIAEFIHRAISGAKEEGRLAQLRKEVEALCADFPLYSPEWEGVEEGT